MDIIVWNKKENPRILIEVKRAWRDNSLNYDAKRLRQLLNKNCTIQKGLIVAYTSASKYETIDSRFESIADKSGTILESRIGPIKRKEEEGVWHWMLDAFL